MSPSRLCLLTMTGGMWLIGGPAVAADAKNDLIKGVWKDVNENLVRAGEPPCEQGVCPTDLDRIAGILSEHGFYQVPLKDRLKKAMTKWEIKSERSAGVWSKVLDANGKRYLVTARLCGRCYPESRAAITATKIN